MKVTSGKTPLILKVGESDASGPLRIRVRSFIQTISMRRSKMQALGIDAPQVNNLPCPYPVKFETADRKREASWYAIANEAFEIAHDICDRIASKHPLYEPPTRMPELVYDPDVSFANLENRLQMLIMNVRKNNGASNGQPISA